MAATSSGAVSWFERVLKVGLRHMLRGSPYMSGIQGKGTGIQEHGPFGTHNTRYDGIFVSDGEESCLVLDQRTAPVFRVNWPFKAYWLRDAPTV